MLAILAYYASGSVGQDAKFGVFGDGGRNLVQSISTHLGNPWDKWLTWPNGAIKVSRRRGSLSTDKERALKSSHCGTAYPRSIIVRTV
jgi:hypothetical protein